MKKKKSHKVAIKSRKMQRRVSKRKPDFVEALLTGLFIGAILGAPIRDTLKRAIKTPESVECPCPCHLIPIHGGVSCPLNCPTRGHRFDGCHDCDCPSGIFYIRHAVYKKRKAKAGK